MVDSLSGTGSEWGTEAASNESAWPVMRQTLYVPTYSQIYEHTEHKMIKLLASLASTYFVVEGRDTRGGVGANFIVKWRSDERVNQPVVEAVMLTRIAGSSQRLRRSQTIPGPSITPSTVPLHG